MRNFNISLALVFTVMCFQYSARVSADVPESTYHSSGDLKNVDKSGDVGLGLMLGSTSGITAKIWTSEINAFDVGVGFQDTNTALMADYLWHWRNAFTPSSNDSVARSFVPYLGLGLIGVWGGNTNFFYHDTQSFGLGARIPIGMEFMPRAVPLGFFAELDPGVGFIPDGFSFFQADIGGRFYF